MQTRTIDLILPRLHPEQRKIKREAKRFNVVRCGRRWGKTFLCKDIILQPALQGYPVAWFAPTYQMLNEVWQEIKPLLEPVTAKVSEQFKQIVLITGGKLDFRSLDNPGRTRGVKYKRVVIDEAREVKNLQSAWNEAIRPTLTDMQGDAWIISTPAGQDNYFFDLCENAEKYPDKWMTWHQPTHANPHISKDELDEVESMTDPLVFRQEYLAEFVSFNDMPFLYAFDPAKHIGDTPEPQFNQPLWISFDFNVEPCAVLIGQHYWDDMGEHAHIFDEINLGQSDLYTVCREIKERYQGYGYFVTGDPSGNARNLSQKSNRSNFQIIAQELGLNPNTQLRQASAHTSIADSRALANSVFSRHPDIKIHPRCKTFIRDCRRARVDKAGQLIKNRAKDAFFLDYLDAGRYLIETWFKQSWLKRANI